MEFGSSPPNDLGQHERYCGVLALWTMKVLELRYRSPMKSTSAVILYLALGLAAAAAPPSSQPSDHYGAQARQVMEHIQKTFWDPAKGMSRRPIGDPRAIFPSA